MNVRDTDGERDKCVDNTDLICVFVLKKGNPPAELKFFLFKFQSWSQVVLFLSN